MRSYLILYGGGALTLLWWLLNLFLLIIYLFRQNKKTSTMCIYAGLLPFILALPLVIFGAFFWAGMGFREGPKPGVFEYIGAVAFTFVLVFCGIYRWRNDKLQKP